MNKPKDKQNYRNLIIQMLNESDIDDQKLERLYHFIKGFINSSEKGNTA